MNAPNQTANRDPVCGMTVDPATAKYSYVHEGTTWYFCADNCRQQFIVHPKHYLKSTEPEEKAAIPRRIAWPREVLIWLLVFVAVVVVVIAGRGFIKKAVGFAPDAKVLGVTAGPNRAIDGGQGGVIAEATHEQKAGDFVFTVSLDTHTVDLTNFDPAEQVLLRIDGQEYASQTAVGTGERSSHHQNYRVSFPPVDATNVTVVVRDVGGIEQRALPFRL